MIAELVMAEIMPDRPTRSVTLFTMLCAFALLFSACGGKGGTSTKDLAGSERPSDEVPMSQRIDRNYPPLIKAILADDADGVREALAVGADPNVKVHEVTPLGFALDGFRCEPGVIRALGEAGADLEALVWPSDISPLHLALNRSKRACVQVLLEFGADFRRSDRLGGTSIHAAAQGGLLDMIDLFVEGGVDINAVTTTGWTAMMFAALNGDEQMIRRMLELGADPCVREPNGRSVANIVRGAGLAALAGDLEEVCRRHHHD